MTDARKDGDAQAKETGGTLSNADPKQRDDRIQILEGLWIAARDDAKRYRVENDALKAERDQLREIVDEHIALCDRAGNGRSANPQEDTGKP